MFSLLKKKLKKLVSTVTKKSERKGKLSKEVEHRPEKIVEKTKEFEAAFPQLKSELRKLKGDKSLLRKLVKRIKERKLSKAELKPILDEFGIELLEADVAYEVIEKIKTYLLENLVGREVKRGKEKEFVVNALKQALLKILQLPKVDLAEVTKRAKEEKKPATLLFLGFNGCGKTTSVAKIGRWLRERGYSCVFAAADCWRAAAIEQLEEHGKKLGIKVIKHSYGADPAAVIFDAIKHAKAKGIDFVLADTAGRSHTNENLMEEMRKIIRVNKPDLKILVIDSLTGNDALMQARFFCKLGIDAVVFTKIDINEKGGAILTVANELRKPVWFLGNGQAYDKLEEFEANQFVERLLS